MSYGNIRKMKKIDSKIVEVDQYIENRGILSPKEFQENKIKEKEDKLKDDIIKSSLEKTKGDFLDFKQ